MWMWPFWYRFVAVFVCGRFGCHPNRRGNRTVLFPRRFGWHPKRNTTTTTGPRGFRTQLPMTECVGRRMWANIQHPAAQFAITHRFTTFATKETTSAAAVAELHAVMYMYVSFCFFWDIGKCAAVARLELYGVRQFSQNCRVMLSCLYLHVRVNTRSHCKSN